MTRAALVLHSYSGGRSEGAKQRAGIDSYVFAPPPATDLRARPKGCHRTAPRECPGALAALVPVQVIPEAGVFKIREQVPRAFNSAWVCRAGGSIEKGRPPGG